ncbi:MAG: T9SS type A sorting domain-containing protein [Bacteroidetes bacterium]|nr:T9SS type A sorting domain-containing protein [Bacteroidota bacterium]
MKNFYWSLFCVVLIIINTKAQNFVELMNKPNANLYEIQDAFNSYFQDKDISGKGNGYKAFKRWENYASPRVYPSGNLALLKQSALNFEEYTRTNSANKFNSSSSVMATTTWSLVGPLGAMTGSANNGLPRKAGRDNFITFHPTLLNTFWVGSPAGGLWQTTNNGSTWTILNSTLAHIGCTDLVVDPTNTQIMYIATGDGYAQDTPSFGVYKSTNGGATWAATTLTFNLVTNAVIRKLIINPTNPLILLAAASNGVWRTTNGGTSWTQINTINTYDLDFKPGDANTVYASGTSFYLSTNGGVSFSVISSGISTTGSVRKNLAVTAANPNYVYVVSALSSNNGFQGVYRSVNSGVTFSLMSSTPDILANNCAGTTGNGQGWYDLAIAASPTNQDEIIVGGVNHWQSLNGGSSWTNIGCWNSISSSPPYVHADVHDIDYRSDGVVYSTNDGGTYYHTGTSWTDITAQRNIAQIYKIGCSALTPNRFITGHQDNGSNLYTGSSYIARLAGDGMDCLIDRTNDSYLIASNPSGNHAYSSNGGVSWTYSTYSPSQSGAWVTPIKQDPSVATRYYSGRAQLYVSNNSAVSFTGLTATGGSGNIVEFAIAPSNNNIIYVLHTGSIRKTTNAGTNWTNVTATVPVGSAALTNLAIHPTNPNIVWVTLSGYSAPNKVFKTIDGGTTWTNVTSNLPNLPCNAIAYEPASNDRIYVGMDVGVYYIDNSLSNWVLYNTGLPNTPINDLEISPAATGLLRAATYGRGVYEVGTVPTLAAPVSNFNFTGQICVNQIKPFNDASSNTPTSWSWSVSPSAGVTIASSNSQNPNITFSSSGIYTVSMVATNTIGSGGVSTQTVMVNTNPSVVLSSSYSVCSGKTATITASGASSFLWNTGSTSSTIYVSPTINTNYTVTGTTAGCVNTKTTMVTVLGLPSVSAGPNNQQICAGALLTFTASGATSYSWIPNNVSGSTFTDTPSSSQTYTCIGTGPNGCTAEQAISVIVVNCTGINLNNNAYFAVYPNPAKDVLYINTNENINEKVQFVLFDANGKLILNKEVEKISNNESVVFNIQSISTGTYFLEIKLKNTSKKIKFVKE